MSSAFLLFAALLLDAVLGEPRWLWDRVPHPAVVMGRIIGWCDTRLNTGQLRRLRGIGVVAALSIGALALGETLAAFGPLAEIVVVAILLAQRSLSDHVGAVADALRLSTGDGRLMVARIVSRDTGTMSDSDVARAAIESAAENLSDGVIAPAFWFLVGGLPGLILYKIVNTADSMIGYRTDRHADFGWAAARFDDLLNLIPARLTAATIALLSGQLAHWSGIASDARRHKSPNAGWPEAAMARALDIALAGPRSYHGQKIEFAYVNPTGRKTLTHNDIDAAVTVLWKTWGMILAACFVITLI
ncbi:adenosylcobinamide-phosphate synthase CbiB [Sulfitobacter sp. JL08]|uniref:adenosylcobinamide-phosphate synthase CbiB n=1 Tax=unclassified Sulfitobacter TaxID=196795 RepID=UPI000E0B3262|nr:adenosylcobinamide-phosphate synthase CbiB [Sulfitobacter sp. JL08]AXI53426.1 adenosylcobinamide-phosphate synthase [Sulfitobacter sp. JL08]